MKFDPKNKVFTEKYRPTLQEFVGTDIKERIQKYINKPDQMPNFIFVSKSPGSGKSSLAYAMIKEMGCDSLILNSSDERTLDVVRNKVKQFAITKSMNGVKKCVFMDEADGMKLVATQEALLTTMEKYSSNVFFIMAVNNINVLIEAIRSRCIEINFSYPVRADVFKFLTSVLDKEEMDYTETGVTELIDKLYPSIRNMILFIQDLSTTNKALVPENVKPNEYLFETMYNALKDKDWNLIKEAVLATNINPRELNTFFWRKAVDNSDIKLIQICCMNEKDIAKGADPKIIVVTSLLDMVK